MIRSHCWQCQVLHVNLEDQRYLTLPSCIVVSEKTVTFHQHGGSHSWDPYCWVKTMTAPGHGGEGSWGLTSPPSTSPFATHSSGPLDDPRGTGEQDDWPHFTLGEMPILRCQFSSNWSTDSMQEKSFPPKMPYPHNHIIISLWQPCSR